MTDKLEMGMEAKHTPGPWRYGAWEQFGDTRFYISQQEGAPYTPYYSDVASLIAETVSSELVAIQQANARLIAAAPELLEALKACSKMILEECADGEHTEQFAQARAAIVKATGRTK